MASLEEISKSATLPELTGNLKDSLDDYEWSHNEYGHVFDQHYQGMVDMAYAVKKALDNIAEQWTK